MIQGFIAKAAISAIGTIGRSGLPRLGGKLPRIGKNLPLPYDIINEKYNESHGSHKHEERSYEHEHKKKGKKYYENYSKDGAGIIEYVLDPLIENLKGNKDSLIGKLKGKEDKEEVDGKKTKNSKMTALLARKILHEMFGGGLQDGGMTVFHVKPVSGYRPSMSNENKMSLKK